MPLHCNINARGKALRLTCGVLAVAAGSLVLFYRMQETGGITAWIISAACILIGAFMIFEARTGWCVLRALGFRTPL